ncbi:MAG: DUF6268 family outer membrane beta-barrel protein [Phycisphaerales bacterium]
MINRLTIACLLAFSGTCMAQAPSENEDRKPEARVNFDAFTTSRADLDDGAGDVRTSGAGGSLSIDFPAGRRGTFTLGAGMDWMFYDFGGSAGFGASDPWNEIRTASFNTRYTRETSERWGWFVGGFGSASGEENADFGESMNYGGYVGGTYAPSRDFYIAFGAGYATRLEDESSFLPVINFNWKFHEKWNLGSDSRGRGGGIKLSHDLTETVTLFAAGGFRFNEFRLNEDGATPHGVGTDRAFPISFGAEWKPAKEIEIGIRAGVLVGREIELSDSEGVELNDADVDATPFLAAELKFRF